MSGGSSQSSQTSNPQLTPQQLINTYTSNLPSILGTTVGQAGQTSQTLANAAAGANPIYTQSGLNQLNTLAPGYQQAGANIANQQAQSTADLINGAGGQAAAAGQALNRSLNPDYYTAQDAASKGAASAVNAINLNGLSPGESNAIERSTNQGNSASGNLGNLNATNTISNAMNFGGAFNNKIGLMNSAVGSASNAANSAAGNAGYSPTTMAVGAGNTSGNFGLGTYNPTQGSASVNVPTSFGSSMFSPIAGNASAANSTGGSSGFNVGCCFIVMESYHGQMPSTVRKCRDAYYTARPQIARGYKKMASWLVPLMRRSMIVRSVVWHTMVHPLTKYSLFVTRKDTTMRRYKWARNFWFAVWNKLGGAL